MTIQNNAPMLIQHYIGEKRGWIRIFGYGISWKNIETHPLIFSERNGYTKFIIFFGWVIKFLSKVKKNATHMKGQSHNLNPHKAARAAMYLWGSEYSKFGGGSMDFWNKLPNDKKSLARRLVDDILQARHESVIEAKASK